MDRPALDFSISDFCKNHFMTHQLRSTAVEHLFPSWDISSPEEGAKVPGEGGREALRALKLPN